MGYIISDDCKNKLLSTNRISKCDEPNDSILRIKSFYGVGEYEDIIAFRRYPRAIPRILKGGMVFTDSGIYKMWPEGSASLKETFWASSKYISTKIKYNDLIYYIPITGYSKEDQPELIGHFSNKNDVSLWDVYSDTDTYGYDIVEVMVEIQQEVINSSSENLKAFRKTLGGFILEQLDLIEQSNDWKKIKNNNSVIRRYLDEIELSNTQWNDVAFVLFAEKLHDKDYEGAVKVLIENGTDNITDEQEQRLDKLFIDTINNTEINEENVNGIMEFGKYNSKYISLTFERYLDFFIDKTDNSICSVDVVNRLNEAISGYIDAVTDSATKSSMINTLDKKINEFMSSIKDEIYQGNYSSYKSGVLIYIISFSDKFYKQAAEIILEYSCLYENLYDARVAIEYIEKNDNKFEKTDIENYKQYVDAYARKYACQYYNKAKYQEKINDHENAIDCLKKTVYFCPEDEDYALELIDCQIRNGLFDEARKEICETNNRKCVCSTDKIEKFNELKIECLEAIHNCMMPYFMLFDSGNYLSIKNEMDSLTVKDQFGLSCYHYGILLDKDDYVSNFNLFSRDDINNVSGYSLIDFACGKKRSTQTYANLMFMSDPDYQEMKKAYQKKLKSIERNEAIAGALGSLMDYAVSNAERNAESEEDWEKIERAREQRDRLSENYNRSKDRVSTNSKVDANRKIKRYLEQKDDKELIKSLCDFKNIPNAYDLEERFQNNFNMLFIMKFFESKFNLINNVNLDDFNSRVIYLLISKPHLLNDLYGDTDDFVIYEDDMSIWYLPEKILNEAINLIVKEPSKDDLEKEINEYVENYYSENDYYIDYSEDDSDDDGYY